MKTGLFRGVSQLLLSMIVVCGPQSAACRPQSVFYTNHVLKSTQTMPAPSVCETTCSVNRLGFVEQLQGILISKTMKQRAN